MKVLRIFVVLVLVLSLSSKGVFAAEKLLTIIHTNDMHSHLQGFSPETDYKPLQPHADKTLGGWSRVAAVIQNTKKEKKNPVIVLDAGDFSMGSFFHMLNREEAFELRLLKAMGYDAVTLGNHEFDLKPDGLAASLRAAKSKGGLPQIVFAGTLFDRAHPVSADLENAFKETGVQDYVVLERDHLKIGIFGMLGKDAVEAAPFAAPLKFRDPLQTARDMVDILRRREKADIVICLSHGGLSGDPTRSEDEILAAKVKGIDIIVSAHTHTKLDAPITVNGAMIVQAWAYGKQVGILDVAYENGKTTLKKYTPVSINGAIAGDPKIQAMIDQFRRKIDKQFLSPRRISYNKVIAETKWDITVNNLEESPLGNLVADAIRWNINAVDSDPNDPDSRVVVAVESRGVIRDDLAAGRTGKITVGDLFRTVPLGIGEDNSMGYPLISFYLYGYELKRALEILTSVKPAKQNEDYLLQVSGLRFTYNPYRAPFDRVTSIEIGGEEQGYAPLDYSCSNQKLYRVGANLYNAAFLKVVGNFTYSLLEIAPKDRKGAPIQDLSAARIDADKSRPGIQELKQWRGLVQYMRSFPDTNDNGIPDVPDIYKKKLGRIVAAPSWNPIHLVSRPQTPTWIALAAFGVAAMLIAGAVIWIIKKRHKAKKARIQANPHGGLPGDSL